MKLYQPNKLLRLLCPAVYRITDKEKVVYLTFDDGPCKETTQRILEILRKQEVKATFFCVGDNNSELLPIVNETGEVIGNATRGQCHDGTKLLHPVVHLHLFDSQGRLYLQHRPLWKTIQPGKWDTAVGGHIDYGEDVPTALKREVVEELGIADCEPRFLRSYLFESEREKDLSMSIAQCMTEQSRQARN